MKKIDNRVLDIEKADCFVKYEYGQALKMNVLKRVLNTPDESFHISSTDYAYASLKIDDNVKVVLYEADADAKIAVFNDGIMIDWFVYQEPYVLSWHKKEEKDSDCKLLRNKIKSIRELKTKVTSDSEKFMSVKTKRFFDTFDVISNM